MMGRWAWAGAVLGLVAGLVLFAPATWLAQALAAASGGRLQLLDARGTVWQGSAQLALSGGSGSLAPAALPGRLDWVLAPRWGALELQLRAACCTPAPLVVRFTPRWNGWTAMLADGRSQWPTAVLAGLGAPWNTVQATGQLQLSSEHLSVEWSAGQMRLAGKAQLDALGMSSRLSTLRPIGSYRLRLTGSDQGLPPQLQLETLEGSLRLSGTGQWTASGWRFAGEASAAPEHETALGNLLNIVGRREGARSIITLG